jgi:hypothetical protein
MFLGEEESEAARVRPSEAALLGVARALVGASVGGLPEVHGPAAPARIGPTAARLLEETLSRGVVLWLCRAGGWQSSEWQGGARGRLWERHKPVQLAFTSTTVAALSWALGEGAVARPALPLGALGLGDELVVTLLCEKLGDGWLAPQLWAQPMVRGAGLPWLLWPEPLARPPSTGERPQVSLESTFSRGKGLSREHVQAGVAAWTTGERAILVEAIAPLLARRAQALFVGLRGELDLYALTAIGEAADTVYSAFVDAALAANRRDLTLPLVDAVVGALARTPIDASLAPELPARESLGARSRALRAAGFWLRLAVRLRRVIEEARAVHYLDDDYAAAQLFLKRCETLDVAGAAKAEAMHARLTRLDAPGSG